MQLREEAAGGGHKMNSTIAMGSLLADMNHDIRTSMNGVRGMLELLLHTTLTPSQQEYARTAQHNVDNLLESLERIVDMSLMETNTFRLNQVPFDLRQETQTALAGKPASALDKGIELSIVYPPSMRLRGDAARLREAFSALADVALQCAAGEAMSLAGSASHLPGGKTRIMLEAYVPRLSEGGLRMASMMHQASDIAPREGGVAGKDLLGMTVCTRIMRMMGGTVTVDLTVPPGAVFRLSVDLPLAPDAMAGLRILAISEQAARWKPLLTPLSRFGAQVEVFDSALTGLAAADAAARSGLPYHSILLGRHVQGMDAGVLGSALKNNLTYRNALLVLLDDRAEDDRLPWTGEGFSARLHAAASAAEVESALISLCMPEAGGQPALSASPAHHGAGSAPIRSGLTILVAEDNPVNQQVAVRMLEKLGCKAEIAADGMQAIEMHAWKRFDLILMDCDMPVLDGLEATQRIRAAEEAGRRTPIIALTACTGQGEQERCLTAGMDDFLSKPIRPQMLGDMLARWLSQPPGSTESAMHPACEDELDEVKEMFGADFAELASLYQNDGPPRLAAMREAAAAGDCAKVAKVAHAFAGSSASIGATGLSALCKTVETSAKTGSLDDFDHRLAGIEVEYRRICGKLHALLTS